MSANNAVFIQYHKEYNRHYVWTGCIDTQDDLSKITISSAANYDSEYLAYTKAKEMFQGMSVCEYGIIVLDDYPPYNNVDDWPREAVDTVNYLMERLRGVTDPVEDVKIDNKYQDIITQCKERAQV
jgi:hypothetical protein